MSVYIDQDNEVNLQSLLEYDQHIEVEKDSWRRADGNCLLEAPYLGSCMAMGVYDSKNHAAYLAHFSTLGNPSLQDHIDSFLEAVQKELKEPYEMLLAGTMSPGSNILEEKPAIEKAREISERMTKNMNCTVDWHDGVHFSRLAVHPVHGIFYEEIME